MAKAQVTITMSADDAKLLGSYQKQIAAEKKKEEATKKTGKAGDDAAKKKVQQNTAETKAAQKQERNLMLMRAGWLGVAAAIAVATKAVKFNMEISDQAAQKNRQALAGTGNIAEISSSRRQFAQLQGVRDRLIASGAFASEQGASAATVSLSNAGLLKPSDLRAFENAALIGQDIPTLATSVSQVQSAFGPSAGGSQDIINQAIQAASITPSTATEVLSGAAGGGARAQRLGFSSQEILAATAVLSRTSGGASEAGTQVESLLTSLQTGGAEFKRGTLLESVQAIAAAGLSDEKLIPKLGRKEAFAAFAGISQDEELFRQTAAGTGGLTLTERANLVRQDPRTAATIAERQAKNDLDIQDRRAGAIRQALATETAELQKGAGGVERFFLSIGEKVGSIAPETTLRARQRNGGLSPTSEAILEGKPIPIESAKLGSIDATLKAIANAGRNVGANTLRAEAAHAQE